MPSRTTTRGEQNAQRQDETPPRPLDGGAGAGVSDTLLAEGTGPITSDALLREAARISSPPRDSLPELKKGELLGRYLIVATLGKGGMGVVYKAEDTKLSRMIALKVLATDGKDQRGRFLREAKSAAAVEHRNIATIHDYGEDEGRVFIAMELVRGQSLDKLLAGKPLPVGEVVRLAREIARGLAAAHTKGIVHRDVKPGNVMISEEKDVKLLDFGLAKRTDRDEDTPTRLAHEHFTTAEKSVIGTPGYMSPEQVKGERVDARTDVFSFGVMLYEMLTGQRPFRGRSAAEVNIAIVRDEPESPSSLNPGTPPAVESLVMRCLHKSADARYADAGQILNELELPPETAPAPTPAAPSVAVTKESGASQHGRSRWMLAVAAIVVVSLGVAWFAMSPSSPAAAGSGSSGGPESSVTHPALASTGATTSSPAETTLTTTESPAPTTGETTVPPTGLTGGNSGESPAVPPSGNPTSAGTPGGTTTWHPVKPPPPVKTTTSATAKSRVPSGEILKPRQMHP